MGIFDSVLKGLFSGNTDKVSTYSSVETVCSDLGINNAELEKIMQSNGINPVNSSLTQSQVDAIYDSYYRSLTADSTAYSTKRTYPAHKQVPVKVWPSRIIREYSTNPVNGKVKYGNKWICFTGTVVSTHKDGQNYVLRLNPDDRNFHGIMLCNFVNNAGTKVLALNRGEHLTVTGFVHDVRLVYQNDTIVIVNSSIVDSFIPKKKLSVSAITSIPDTKIQRSVIPGLNDKVYTESGRSYTLTRFISSGGEGSVYGIDAQGRVAKIYNEESCTARLREKIRLMATNRLNFKGICFPLEVLNNANGEFTGFIMEEARGTTLSCLKMPQQDFLNAFPSWKKDDLVCLAISILKKIEYLHNHGVLMGDISLKNIMFVSPYEVYFIDTDSYQYGPFPCSVGTDEFVAPELLGRDLGSIMRTEGNENFAVATLLFMLMMQGKQPYAHQGGSQSASDIKAMIFPYGTGTRPVPGNVWELQPIGLWRYIWSHLPHKLKNAFIDTFRKDGSNNTESTRFSVHDWLVQMYAYHTAMSKMVGNDTMSAELFPTREKYSKDIVYRKCKVCGEMLPEAFFYDDTTCKVCYDEAHQ